MARADEPAFPQHVINPTAQSYGVASNTGMSIREWFAGQALIGVILAAEACYALGKRDKTPEPNEYAHDAFLIADAMIAQAEKK